MGKLGSAWQAMLPKGSHGMKDGVKHFFASGLQNSVFASHTVLDAHSAPAFVQSWITGSQMGKFGLALHALESVGSHISCEGVKHFCAPGEQNSVDDIAAFG